MFVNTRFTKKKVSFPSNNSDRPAQEIIYQVVAPTPKENDPQECSTTDLDWNQDKAITIARKEGPEEEEVSEEEGEAKEETVVVESHDKDFKLENMPRYTPQELTWLICEDLGIVNEAEVLDHGSDATLQVDCSYSVSDNNWETNTKKDPASPEHQKNLTGADIPFDPSGVDRRTNTLIWILRFTRLWAWTKHLVSLVGSSFYPL